MSRLLIHDYPLMVSPRLAVAIGLNEAIFLQQLHYWLGTSGKERDGRRWVYNTLPEWNAQFPFWGLNTVRRTIGNLEEGGLVDSTDAFNVIKSDRTKWYTINYPAVEALEAGLLESTGHLPKMGRPSAQNGQVLASAQNGQVIPETEITSETLKDGAENRRAGQVASSSPPEADEQPPHAFTGPTETADKGSRRDHATKNRNVPGGGAAARAADMPLPGALAALEGFAVTWAEWLAYRRARRLTTAPATLKRQLEMLEGQPDPRAVVEQTITNGWNGLFPLKAPGRPRTQADANARAVQTAQAVYAALQEDTDVPF